MIIKINSSSTVLVAMLAYEANRKYCKLIGDDTQLPWADTPENIKNSLIAGVEALKFNPSMTPEEQHESWMRYKIEDGWKYGPVKDIEKKTHPCMIEYRYLPPEQRFKDYIFNSVVTAGLAIVSRFEHTDADERGNEG